MKQVTTPSGPVEVRNIYCIGRNYKAHAKELGNDVPTQPVVFLKTRASVRGLEPSPMAFANESFHFEAELVLLIGKSVRCGSRAGWDSVQAAGLGLDLTRRDAQSELKKAGLPWTLAKSFNGAAVLTPMVEIHRFKSLDNITFDFELNGEHRQHGETKMMIFPVEIILTFLASFNDLEPGDIVFTGTPEGVGPMRVGDHFKLSLSEMNLSFTGQL